MLRNKHVVLHKMLPLFTKCPFTMVLLIKVPFERFASMPQT